MKNFLAVALWLGLFSSAHAGTAVYEVAQGTGTMFAVSITSASGAVQVDGGIRRVETGRNAIEIYNDDADDPLFCSFNINLTTAAVGASDVTNIGRRVEARKSIIYSIPAGMNVYCRATGTDPTTNTAIAVITQLK